MKALTHYPFIFLCKIHSLLGTISGLHISVVVVVVCGVIRFTVGIFSMRMCREIIAKIGESNWVDVVSSIFPSTKLIISGDLPDKDAPGIIIANHQSDADWWYIWEVARVLKRHGDVKIILKEDVGHIPVIGWGLRLFDFILLKRNWASDRRNLVKKLAAFAKDSFPMLLLLFPEGTTINTVTMEKCRKFAAENNRPVLKRLLLPRTTGFKGCLASLPREGKAYNVYDMTIAYSSYSGEIPTWEMGYSRNIDHEIPSVSQLMMFRTCREVHIHVKKIPASQVQENTDAWLDDTWVQKEALLEAFIKDQCFPKEICGRAVEYRIKKRWSLLTMVLVPSLIPLYMLQVILGFIRPEHL